MIMLWYYIKRVKLDRDLGFYSMARQPVTFILMGIELILETYLSLLALNWFFSL